MATRSAPVKLLIVEPEAVFRRNLFHRLRLEQWLVFEAAEEEQVKRLLRRHDMDVVLLGLKSLQQQGLAMLRSIKAVRPETEVILLTGTDHLALAIAGMRLGAFDDLLMPFDMQTLLRRIREACTQRRSRQSSK